MNGGVSVDGRGVRVMGPVVVRGTVPEEVTPVTHGEEEIGLLAGELVNRESVILVNGHVTVDGRGVRVMGPVVRGSVPEEVTPEPHGEEDEGLLAGELGDPVSVLFVNGGVTVDGRGVRVTGPVVRGTVPEEVTPVLQKNEDVGVLASELVKGVSVILVVALLVDDNDIEVIEIGVDSLNEEGKPEVVELIDDEVSVTTEVMVIVPVDSATVVVSTGDVSVESVAEDETPLERGTSDPELVWHGGGYSLVKVGVGDDDEILVPSSTLRPRCLGTWSNRAELESIF
jgi:hypothetical protein